MNLSIDVQQFSGDNSQEILRKITLLIASELPSEFLKQQAQSNFQKQKWLQIKDTLYWVGACWWTKITSQSNPLNQLLEEGVIDQWDYDYVVSLVDIFQRLWELVYFAESFIREEARRKHQPYPFDTKGNSSAALFIEIIRADANGTFQECLKYIEASVPKYERSMRLFQDSIETGLSQSQKLRNCMTSLAGWGRPDNFWLKFSLKVCQAKAKSNRRIEVKLHNLEQALQIWAGLVATACRKRPSTTWRLWRSYSCNHSDLPKAGRKEGGTYS